MWLYLHVGVGDDGTVDDWVDAAVSTENEVQLICKFLQGCLLHLRIILLLLLIFILLLIFVLILLFLFVPFLVLLFHKQL